MDIGNTVALLARDPNLMAWREAGTAIAVFPNGVVMRVLRPKPHRWQPTLRDLVAVDWQTGTVDEFYKKYRPDAEVGE
jgi:hypothetical protein